MYGAEPTTPAESTRHAPADTVVVDFSHHSNALAERPFQVLAELRELAPIAWSTAHDGFWVVTDHQDVIDGLADHERFTSSFGPAIPANPFGTRHIPVGLDPPLHTTYRRVLNNWVSMI